MDSSALEAIVDVALGMVFMWLILSVATMSIQEWIASYLKWRAKDLETAIRRLLGNDQLWTDLMYAHPLIQGLSQKWGARPSYIPANKFALALLDVVATAGTEQSFIQQQLLYGKGEMDKAPDQLLPFLGYMFKRFQKYFEKLGYRFTYLFGSNRGLPEQKLEGLLKLSQNLFHESHSAMLADLQEKLKRFFLEVISDQTTLSNGKEVTIPSKDFLKTYPFFHNSIFGLLNIVLENQPALKLRWAEIIVNNDKKLISQVRKDLEEGQTLREKLRELVQEKAKNLDLRDEDIELVLNSIRQTLDEINFIPAVDYIQELMGTSKGLGTLQELNPSLFKSLSRLSSDVIGIANSPQAVEAVRERFAEAVATLEQADLQFAAMRINVETWFNESMDRLGGWYKRKSQVLAFFIGLAFAIVLNVDSIALIDHLWKEPAVRDALVANATEFANENSEIPSIPVGDNEITSAVEYFNAQFKDLNIPLGWESEVVDLEPNQTCQIIPVRQSAVWGFKGNLPANQCQKISNAPADAAGWSVKFIGIIFSAAAAAQGAPFWFDILKKVVNIRGTGAKPDDKK